MWRLIKNKDDADQKRSAKNHELRAKNPENQRHSEIEGAHSQIKMVCAHIQVFFCHAAKLVGILLSGFRAQHEGHMRVQPER